MSNVTRVGEIQQKTSKFWPKFGRNFATCDQFDSICKCLSNSIINLIQFCHFLTKECRLLRKFWVWSGAEIRKSCRLKNEYKSWYRRWNEDFIRPSAGPARIPHYATAGDLVRLTLNPQVVNFSGEKTNIQSKHFEILSTLKLLSRGVSASVSASLFVWGPAVV